MLWGNYGLRGTLPESLSDLVHLYELCVRRALPAALSSAHARDTQCSAKSEANVQTTDLNALTAARCTASCRRHPAGILTLTSCAARRRPPWRRCAGAE
jgi:hypothetical protein